MHLPHRSAKPHSHRRRSGFAAWVRNRHIARFELGCVAAFHLAAAFTIAFAPRDQVITPGTSALFGTIPLPIWVAAFTLAGSAAALSTWRLTPLRLSMTWCQVFPLGVAWIYGFAVAVTDGRGNAVFALVWPFLLVWWLTTAIRLYVGGSETRWGGG